MISFLLVSTSSHFKHHNCMPIIDGLHNSLQKKRIQMDFHWCSTNDPSQATDPVHLSSFLCHAKRVYAFPADSYVFTLPSSVLVPKYFQLHREEHEFKLKYGRNLATDASATLQSKLLSGASFCVCCSHLEKILLFTSTSAKCPWKIRSKLGGRSNKSLHSPCV